MDRPDLALGVYQLSTNIFPKDINLLSQLGLLLHHAGLEEQAQPIFEKLLSIHPHNAQAHLGLGEIDSALGLLDESAQHYEQALETLTNLPALWRDYSEVLYRKRDYKTAETAARKSLDLTPALETFVDLAFIQRGQGDTSGAIKTLDTALSRWPERQDASLLRATWLLEAGRFDEALPAAQAALAQDGAQPLALWIRARVELARGQKKEALTDLSLAAQASRTAPFVAKASEALLKELREARR
jgi:tetratricopeptide (TPR) repeat protein